MNPASPWWRACGCHCLVLVLEEWWLGAVDALLSPALPEALSFCLFLASLTLSLALAAFDIKGASESVYEDCLVC